MQKMMKKDLKMMVMHMAKRMMRKRKDHRNLRKNRK